MYLQRWHDEPALTGHLRIWLQSNPSWWVRQERTPENDIQVTIFWTLPPSRQASADEIAADIVDDQTLREVLGFLASRDGQVIEDAVARLWLPAWQAQLLTVALTGAWQIVLDQNRPIWQRTEVLVGAGLGAVALLAWASRSKS